MSGSREVERETVPSIAQPRITGLFARVGLVFVLFALLAAPLLELGGAESPALLARADHPEVAIAVVGDSRAHVGVSPTRIGEALARAGMRSDGFNFAVDGTDVLHHADFVIRGLLERGHAPSVIVWAPNPLGFNDSRTNNRLEQLTKMDLGLLRRAGAPFELQLDLITMRLFPPYRQRPLVGAKIAELTELAGKRGLELQTSLLRLSWTEPPLSREYLPQPDGHEPFSVLEWKDRFERGARGYEADYAALGETRWHLAIGRELVRRARAAGVVVVVVELPVAPYFREHFARDPRHLKWREELSRMAKEEGALYWDHSGLYADDRLFGDPAHMTDTTSYTYSSWLGEQLAKEPAARAALAARR